MIPAPFDYKRAGSAAEAISIVGQYGDDAKFLAGGHSLLPLMKLRLAQPAVLVDIARVSDLSYIRDAGDHVAIGALTRHTELEHSSLLQQHVPLLSHAASHVGDPQVRHRGTLGGSIANADPASDLPATTLALGATYVAQGPNGTREIAATDFYKGFLESALAADEMLTEIRVPKMDGAGWSFQKFNRRAQDWAAARPTRCSMRRTSERLLRNPPRTGSVNSTREPLLRTPEPSFGHLSSKATRCSAVGCGDGFRSGTLPRPHGPETQGSAATAARRQASVSDASERSRMRATQRG